MVKADKDIRLSPQPMTAYSSAEIGEAVLMYMLTTRDNIQLQQCGLYDNNSDNLANVQ